MGEPVAAMQGHGAPADKRHITVQDCLDAFQYAGQAAVLGNGQVAGFEAEMPAQGCGPGQAVENDTALL